MSVIDTPNMNLPLPAVGNQPGPGWAENLNAALTLVDSHDHTPGYGVPIPPGGLDINTALTFNDNFAINLAGLTLTAQSSQPDINTIYEAGVDLYFVDGDGNNVRITQGGNVVGTAGSITGLVPPASASYVSLSKTFVWQSDTNVAANMDFASALFRNITPNSTFALTLQPPAALSSDFSLTLPLIPSTKKIVTIDTSGNIVADTTVDGTTIVIPSNVIGIANGGVNTAQLANGAVTAAKTNISYQWTTVTVTTTSSVVIPAGVNHIEMEACGGGGGGSAGTAVNSGGSTGGSGGNGAVAITQSLVVTPSETLAITIGAGGAGGLGQSTTGGGLVNGFAGNPGGDTSVVGSFGTLTFKGVAGPGTTTNVSNTVGASTYFGTLFGGAGGIGASNNGNAGTNTPNFSGGTGSVHISSISGSGGGGASYRANGGNAGAPSTVQAGNNGSNGSMGSGGGGGGATSHTPTAVGGAGGAGGNGYVIIRYLLPS